ncbi:MAG TPA: DUF5777 family beta-barrel protein [Bacteroidales bacterium]|nr:DUF5777 family beta-barrel protein [Bacteroidales bacterium]
MKRYIHPRYTFFPLLVSLLMVLGTSASAQETTEEETGPDKRPAKPAFESGLLFDQQTSTIPVKNTLEFVIQHRFATVENGISDLWGIWGVSNIRLGLNFVPMKNLMVGWGTTKYKKAQDFQVKYNILQQTRSNTIPVSLTLYSNWQIDCSADAAFGDSYKFSNRYSYFTELIITRRFSNALSVQVAPTFTHFNAVDSLVDHDRIGISMGARYKVSPQISLIATYDLPLKIKGITEWNPVPDPAEPNFCVGAEISTSTHAFHLWLGSSQGILPQEVMMTNKNNFFDGQFLLGLNITRLWNF